MTASPPFSCSSLMEAKADVRRCCCHCHCQLLLLLLLLLLVIPASQVHLVVRIRWRGEQQ